VTRTDESSANDGGDGERRSTSDAQPESRIKADNKRGGRAKSGTIGCRDKEASCEGAPIDNFFAEGNLEKNERHKSI
jgi:hypothetical protein